MEFRKEVVCDDLGIKRIKDKSFDIVWDFE